MLDEQNIMVKVGEKVMGWEQKIDRVGLPVFVKPDGSAIYQCHWHPDTSIADAMLVLAEVRTWTCSKRQRFIQALETQQADEKQTVRYDPLYWLLFVADNIPTAICLATLATVEEERTKL